MKNLEEKILEACRLIPPLWPLSNFVAVNPYLGFSGKSFDATALFLKQVQDADLLMPLDWYRRQFASGKIGSSDLRAAVSRAPDTVRQSFAEAGARLDESALAAEGHEEAGEGEPLYRPGAFSAFLDSRFDTHWRSFVREEAAKWCAAFYDRGQSSWSFPWKESSFYAAWREAVRHDRNPACAGLDDARRSLRSLDADPVAAIKQALSGMGVPEELEKEWLYRVLLTLPGWAGHLRHLDREDELKGGGGDRTTQLLAVLLSYEWALFRQFARDEDCLLGWKRILMESPVEEGASGLPLSLARRLLWQDALEHAVESRLRSSIRPAAPSGERPQVQAAFCIDVRSELFRRNLESASPSVRTIGFAGFFGVPLRHSPAGGGRDQSRCPALLSPPVASSESCGEGCDGDHDAAKKGVSARMWKRFREASGGCFSFVETFGLAYAAKLLAQALGFPSGKASAPVSPVLDGAMDLPSRVDLAAGILKGLGLDGNCAPLVLLCGHGSSTRNNPYASGLDCGACGGHPGDANARIAAALLNHPEVRKGLAEKGLAVPDDTVFVAGLHDTTTDEVVLYDRDRIDASHRKQVDELEAWLELAGDRTAALRAGTLGEDASGRKAVRRVRARSRDASQVRPEWGLAGNAGFIVAPRSWTRAGQLGGRAFLHEYDAASDPEGALLETVLAGPLVVGSWINLQYYGSAVDNRHYGSGHKAIHNVISGLGVGLGNETDLRPGLPLQSLHDGRRLRHEPVRLHACIAADRETIDAILARHPEVAELVDNRWLHLFALGAAGSEWSRRLPGGGWQVSREQVRAAGAVPGSRPAKP